MKHWSILLIASIYLSKISAQDFDVEIVEDIDQDDFVFDGFSEAVFDGPGPCNGYPEYRNLPINQHFYLGTSQPKDITQAVNDGLRYLDIELCKNNDDIVVCSDNTPTTETFLDVVEKTFNFTINSIEQFFILNIKTTIEPTELESTIDTVCEKYTNLVEGVDEFKKNNCEFLYTFRPQKGAWSSMSDILNYKPDMAQWEGDGETVGIRTKFMLTLNEDKQLDSVSQTAYFSPAFWRPVQLDQLQKECKIPMGGIHLDISTTTQDIFENLLIDRSACNLNDSPLNSFINIVSVKDYEQHLPYLAELEARMVNFNFAKWSGTYTLLEPSKIINKIQRDEL